MKTSQNIRNRARALRTNRDSYDYKPYKLESYNDYLASVRDGWVLTATGGYKKRYSARRLLAQRIMSELVWVGPRNVFEVGRWIKQHLY